MSQMANFRDLGTYSIDSNKTTKVGKFYRSDAPIFLSEEDITLVRKLGITDVIDYRGDSECEAHPNFFNNIHGIRVHRIALFDPFKDSKFKITPISESYMEIAESDGMDKALRILLEAKGAVLFHCTAGKDRTGTTAAILQMLAGVHEVDIIADYVLSDVYLRPMLDEFAARGDFPDECIYPRYENIKKFLDIFRSKYKSIEEFLLSKKLSLLEIETLRSKLI